MTWLLLATAGQFINAIVALLDKYIVSDDEALPRPFVYAFYSCLVTSFWVVIYFVGFIPGLSEVGVPSFANVQSPTIQVVGMSFLAAYTFFMALVSMYDGLKSADASDVMPVVGAVAAISSFGMSYLFLDTVLTPNFIWGICLLAVGTLLVSQMRFTSSVVLHTIHSGIFFSLHYITMKGLFLETSFDDGFFWSRVGFIAFALSLLLVPSYYAKITEQTKKTTKKGGMLVLAAKLLAGVAAFMLLKATDMGDVTVVQALDGLKYVFIILFGILFGRFIPKAAGENAYDTKTIVRKVLYVAIISIGFIILFR
ncbi:MAG: drug/metabolite transporter (DMT)-like permease [Patiriisocius sp.]|jgi:drug/metabolite transporter (DMT)-like permease